MGILNIFSSTLNFFNPLKELKNEEEKKAEIESEYQIYGPKPLDRQALIDSRKSLIQDLRKIENEKQNQINKQNNYNK